MTMIALITFRLRIKQTNKEYKDHLCCMRKKKKWKKEYAQVKQVKTF